MKAIRENSNYRIVWDFFILLLIIASCILIPFQFAFRHVALRAGTELLYLINFFFLIDILLNFFTSYRKQGVEVRDTRKTATHYLKTVFAVDLIANFPFDILLLGNYDIQVFNISLVIFFRMFHLLRVVRLFVIFRRWEGMNWTNSGYLRILKFCIIGMLLVHWVACSWFLISFIENFPKDGWVVRAGILGERTVLQYIRALYWTITTMTTVGYGDITPVRTGEYILTMFVMLLGASMYAFIIGKIASLFTKIDSAKVSYWNRVEAVIQYLRYRNVPRELNSRVRNYYEYMWAEHRGLEENESFNDLPGPLRVEILLHLAKELLNKVPMFKYAAPALRDALLLALKLQTYSPEDHIMREGEVGKEILFLSKGEVEISSQEGTKIHGALGGGDYFGHISLILRERRTASVKAKTYCEIFMLTNDDFKLIKNDYPEFTDVMKRLSSEKPDKISALVLERIIL